MISRIKRNLFCHKPRSNRSYQWLLSAEPVRNTSHFSPKVARYPGPPNILSRASLAFVNSFTNVLGSIVTGASAAFPWYLLATNNVPQTWFYVWNGGFPSEQDLYSLSIILLVIGGAVFSLFSRLGGALTILGCVFYPGPPWSLRTGLMNESDYFLFGYYLALEGAVISLLGCTRNSILIDLLSSRLRLVKRAT